MTDCWAEGKMRRTATQSIDLLQVCQALVQLMVS